MAKIKFGMMMTDARGKLGGQVFSKNRSGSYVRTKVTPVNPQTSFQQASRMLLGNLSASWSALTDEQRTKWNSAVDDWIRTNVFGDSVKPTGKNLYVQLNKVNSEAGNPILAEPPVKQELPIISFNDAILALSGGAISSFTVSTNGDSTGFKLQIRATPQMSAGTTFAKNRYRVIDYIAGDDRVNASIKDSYGDRFGSTGYNVDGAIFVEVRVVATSGQVSAPIVGKVEISEE